MRLDRIIFVEVSVRLDRTRYFLLFVWLDRMKFFGVSVRLDRIRLGHTSFLVVFTQFKCIEFTWRFCVVGLTSKEFHTPDTLSALVIESVLDSFPAFRGQLHRAEVLWLLLHPLLTFGVLI